MGKVLLVYEINIQVLPTAPSPTVTHFINLDALISKHQIRNTKTTMPRSKWAFPCSPPSESIVHQGQQKERENQKINSNPSRILKIERNQREWRIWILEKGGKWGMQSGEIPNCRSREKERKMGGKWGYFERNEMRLKRSPAFPTFCHQSLPLYHK